MADLRFAFSRGGPGYEMDWQGERVIIKAVASAKVGINETMRFAVNDARSRHAAYPPESEPFERFADRTGQMIAAIQVLEEAEILWDPPRVRGEWGIRDGPAFQDPDIWSGRWPGMRPKFRSPQEGQEQPVSIYDRAVFLEFGTIKMAPRPFLYPAWDDSKLVLPIMISLANRGMAGGRGNIGRFSFS